MNYFFGLLIVAAIIVYKRSTEIITINPLPRFRAPQESGAPDFGAIMGAVQQMAEQQQKQQRQRPKGNSGGNRGRAAIRSMVEQGQFLEAIELYRRIYGVDESTAKSAVDEMMLQQ